MPEDEMGVNPRFLSADAVQELTGIACVPRGCQQEEETPTPVEEEIEISFD